MSFFKKTRSDQSPVAHKPHEAELETSYPRIEEASDEVQTRVSNTAIYQPEPATTRVGKTINPYTQTAAKAGKSVVKLTPIPKDGEPKLPDLNIDSGSTILNRQNIDAENATISSKNHALIEIKNGQVFLSNQTAAETTFIQVRQPTQLHNGDVILLGDRLLRVEIEDVKED